MKALFDTIFPRHCGKALALAMLEEARNKF